MKLKTYFSGTVEAAMDLARNDLGPDTMIVYSRRADPENRHLGEYEVVFALEEGGEQSAPPAPVPPPSADLPSRVAAEMADLRRQMERITAVIHRNQALHRTSVPELSGALQELLDAGIDPGLAQEILEEAQSPETLRDPAGLRNAAWRELAARLRCDCGGGGEPAGAAGRRIIALVGPPGAGKTLTLVKLAAVLGLSQRRSVQILSADNVKIGAPDQLRTYAAILGIPFQVVETPHALERALEETRDRKLVLIDTPGYSSREMAEAEGLAETLAQAGAVEVHLVLSAETKTADLQRAVERYRVFGVSRLLFTHVDETASYGSVLNTAIRNGLPLSYLSTGQSVPEDIEPAAPARLLGTQGHIRTGEASAA